MNIQPQGRHRQHADAAQKALGPRRGTTHGSSPIDLRSNDAYEPFGHAAKTKALKVIIDPGGTNQTEGPAGGEHGVGNFRTYRDAAAARYVALHPQPRGLMSASSEVDSPVGSPEATGWRLCLLFWKRHRSPIEGARAHAAHTLRACLLAGQSCWSVFVNWCGDWEARLDQSVKGEIHDDNKRVLVDGRACKERSGRTITNMVQPFRDRARKHDGVARIIGRRLPA